MAKKSSSEWTLEDIQNRINSRRNSDSAKSLDNQSIAKNWNQSMGYSGSVSPSKISGGSDLMAAPVHHYTPNGQNPMVNTPDVAGITKQRDKIAKQYQTASSNLAEKYRSGLYSREELEADRASTQKLKVYLDNLNKRLEQTTAQANSPEMLRNAEYFSDNQKKYSSISGRSDFAKKSKDIDERRVNAISLPFDISLPSGEKITGIGIGDDNYAYINDINDRRSLSQTSRTGNIDQDAELRKFDYMTDDEIATYNYLYNVEGRKSAEEYLDYIGYYLDAERMQDLRADRAKFATDHPVAASAQSVGTNLVSGVGLLDIAGQRIVNNARQNLGYDTMPVNYNRQAMNATNATTAIRGTISQNLADEYGSIKIDQDEHPILSRILNGKSLGDVYQLGMSMLDSSAVAGLGAVTGLGTAGTLLLGGSAGSQGVIDALDKGATDEQAIAMGILNGTFEALFEEVSLDKLMNGNTGSIVKDFLSQAFVEGSEEVSTSIANTIADILVMAQNSDYESSVNEYIDKGLSPSQAAVKAMEDIAIGMGWDFVGGALSGGIMGGVNSAAQKGANSVYDNIIEPHYYSKTYGADIESMVSEALKASPDNELAKSIQQKLEDGKKVSGKEIRDFVNQNEQTNVDDSTQEEEIDPVSVDGYQKLVSEMDESPVDSLSVEEGNIPAHAEKASHGENSGQTVVINSKTIRSIAADPQRLAEMGIDPTGKTPSEIRAEVRSALEAQQSQSADPETEAADATAQSTGDNLSPTGSNMEQVDNETAGKASMVEQKTDDQSFPATQNTNSIEAASKQFGKQAQAFVHTYRSGQDVGQYTDAMKTAFQYGASGDVSLDAMKGLPSVAYLTDAQKEIAYEMGRASVNNETASVNQTPDSKNPKRKGAVKLGKGVKVEYLNKKQMAAYRVIRQISEATGVDVVLDMTTADENGVFTQEEGSYTKGTNEIHVDLNSGLVTTDDIGKLSKYTALRTFSHEFTHWLQDADAKGYAEFKQYIFDRMNENFKKDSSDGESVSTAEDLVNRKLEQYREKVRPDFTYEEAEDEVIADAMTDILPESSFLEQLYQDNRSLFEKIVDRLKEFINDLKEYFDSLAPNRKLEALALKDGIKYMEGVAEAFDKLVLSAVENSQKTVPVEESAQTASAENLTPSDIKKVSGSDGNQLFQLRTMKQDLDFYMQDLVDAGLVGDGKAMTKTELDNLYKSINRVMGYVENHLAEIERNESFREMDGTNRPFLPYKSNSDPHYKMALDYSTLCRKRLLTQAITERLQASLKRALTPVEQVKIRNEIKKLQAEGKKIDVACALCYVEAARLKSPKVINEFLNNKSDSLKNYFSLKNSRFVNEVYKKRCGDWKEAHGLPRNATKNDIKNAGLKVADFNKFAKEVRNGYWDWLRENDPETFSSENAVIQKAESMDNEKFLSAVELAKMRRDTPNLYDAFISKVRSATRSKAQETDVPYKRGDINQVGQSIIDQMNKESGFRHQSWSDFQAMHLLDTISAVIELSTKNAKVHTYTKVADMVRFLGDTGMMINMSLIPNGNNGLLEDGSLDFDPVEGIDFDAMKNLRDQFPETAGNIAIGISDQQILALLASPYIDYVIPYHTSGLNADMRKRMGIRAWKDYTKYQNESGNGDAPGLSEWFNEKDAQSYANGYEYMVEASKKYLDLCYERGLTPKFPQFLQKDSEGRYQLRNDAQNYWKLLVDRKMVNQVTKGVIIQQAVLPRFNEDTMLDILSAEVNSQAAKDAREAEDIIVNKLLNEPVVFTKAELEQARILRDAAIRMAIENTADEVETTTSGISGSEVEAIPGNKQFSVRDSDGNQLSAEQQEYFKASKVRDENGNLRVVYHGTDAEFTVFDKTKGRANMDIQGMFFSPYAEDAEGYGGKVGSYYLNIKNPASEGTAYKALNRYKGQNNAGVKAREYLESLGYDGVYNGYDEYIAFDSNQVKRIDNTSPTSNPDIRYQIRESNLSDTDVLVMAAEAVQKRDAKSKYSWLTDKDRDALSIFYKKATALQDAQKNHEELLNRKRELQKNDNDNQKDELRKVNSNLNTVNKQIRRLESELLNVESKTVFKDILKKSRRVVEKDTRQRGLEELSGKKHIKQIQDTAMKLSEWLQKNSDKEHIPEVLKKPLGELLTSIDFSSKRYLKGGKMTKADQRFGENIVRLRQLLNGQYGSMNGDESSTDEIGAYLDLSGENRQFINELADKIASADGPYTVNEMSADELKKLSKFMRNLAASIRKANTLLANARYQNVPAMAQESMNHFDEFKTSGVLNGNGAAKFASWTNATPYYAFKRFGKAGEALFDAFTRGWEKMAFNAKEVIDFTRKTFSAKESTAWRKEIKEIKLDSGEKIRMTTAQIMELSVLINREQAQKHIKNGGIRIGDIKNRIGVTSDTNHYHLTADDINRIVGKLTTRQRKVASELQGYMAKRGSEWGNEISMARFGYNFYEEGENYYPIRSDRNGIPMSDTDDNSNSMFRLLNLSASKSLDPKATNALIVGDIFDTFTNHMSDMAKMNALALPILDAIKWFNFKEKVHHSDGGFTENGTKKSMEKAFGTAAGAYFRTVMKDINGAVESSDRGAGLASKLTSNYKIAAVAANLRVALLQPTSYVRAMYILKPKNMVNALLFKKNAYDEAMKYSGTAVWKSLGYYDTDIARTMRSQIEHDESLADVVKEKSMALAEIGDQRTWGRLWVACKLEAKDRNHSLTGEELKKATADIFREVIYATQVMDSTLTRSEMMRGTSKWTKAATAFMAEPTLSYNILMDCVSRLNIDTKKYGFQKAWQRNSGKVGLSIATYVCSAAFAAVVESIADAFRDDDDYEKFLEKFGQAFLGEDGFMSGNIGQDLTILGKIPVVKDVINIIRGSKSSDMSIASIESITNAYNIWMETYKLNAGIIDKPTQVTWNGKMTGWGKVYKTLQALSQMSGFAVSNLTRDVVALYNTLIAENFGTRKVKTYDPGTKNSIKYAYNDGYLTEQEAIEKLIEAGEAKDENEAYFIVSGFDGDGKYGEIKNAVSSGDKDAFKTAAKNLTDHGVEMKDVQSKAKGYIKDSFNDGSMTAEDAKRGLVDFAGKTSSEASAIVTGWQFYSDHPDLDWEESTISKYLNDVKPSGISVDAYDTYLAKLKACTGEDKNGDGKTDSGSKKSQVISMIDGLPITNAQKDVLYYLNNYASSKINETPWH